MGKDGEIRVVRMIQREDGRTVPVDELLPEEWAEARKRLLLMFLRGAYPEAKIILRD